MSASKNKLLGEGLLTTWEFFLMRLIFRDVPGVTPRATIDAKILWRIGRGDLVSGGGQCFAFSGVLAFAGDRAFRFVVHCEVLRVTRWCDVASVSQFSARSSPP